MPDFKEREIIIVLGKTGQGKSIWTRYYCKNLPRVFASDLLQDFRANYVTRDALIKLHYDQIINDDSKFRIATYEADDLSLLGSIAFLQGTCHLVMEEMGFYFEPGSRAPSWMREAAFLGRHRELSLILTAQRPTSIPTDLRSQASRIICFNQIEKSDIGWLSSYFGERMDEISELAPLECLDATASGIDRYKIDWRLDDKQQETQQEKSDSFKDLGYK